MSAARVVPAGPRRDQRAAAARSARRRRLGRRAGYALVAAAPLVALGWLLLSSPVLAVDAVAVSGTERLTPEQVRRAAAVADGAPLARVDIAAVARRVRELPTVAEVRVSRDWPGTLRVRVVERTAVAGLVTRAGVTLIDAQGVPFAAARALPPGTVRLQVPRPGPSDPTTRAALDVLAELPPGLRRSLRILRAASPSSVTLVLAGGRQVLWGDPGDGALKAQAASALLRLPGTFYDVSRPSVVTRR